MISFERPRGLVIISLDKVVMTDIGIVELPGILVQIISAKGE